MPLTTRRSTRTRNGDKEYEKSKESGSPAATKLSTLIEREETPRCGAESNLTALVSASPLYPVLQTPRSTAGITPSFEEAHPSKVQRSTAKQLDTGLLFGFVNVDAKNTKHNGTPTKSNRAPPPDLESQFTRPLTGLGPEARKMIDELKGEITRNRKTLEAERDAEKEKNGEQEGNKLISIGGRKIARAKGKSGRFSDAHMTEFRKMDSIVGHPSAFRTQPGRFAPATTSLKRTKSQSKLDSTYDGPARAKSLRSTGEDEDGYPANISRAKRIKTSTNEDGPNASWKTQTKARDIGPSATPSILRSKSGSPTTSLVRSASVKRSASTRIPTASLKSLRHINFTGLKPILQGQESAVSGSALHEKIPTGPFTPPKVKNNISKDHPSLPLSPMPGLTRTATTKRVATKRVAFAPGTTFNLEQVSTSSAGGIIPKSQIPTNISYPTLPTSPRPSETKASQLHSPGVFTFRADKKLEFGFTGASTIRRVAPSCNSDGLVKASGDFHVVPHGIPNKKRRHDDTSDDDEPASKRNRGAIQWTPALHQKTGEEQKTKSKTNGTEGKKKGVLSLSRLNVLATPKKRKVLRDGAGGTEKKIKAFWRA
ncbi:hypothetical protein GP486_001765 [Trichoglossum hirsutum]|uniref:Erythromycin esterase n=1 Tax=Trichoglossum hirsutum TaxID=265104 RepID=A0A9P8RSS6_9PEZI|nr:hypothetical protein GP486_001765 [Trichoglossum hirsutum]